MKPKKETQDIILALEELKALMVEQTNLLKATLWAFADEEDDDYECDHTPEYRASKMFSEKAEEFLNWVFKENS